MTRERQLLAAARAVAAGGRYLDSRIAELKRAVALYDTTIEQERVAHERRVLGEDA